MARGRMINQKIAQDIDFNEMSIDAQFLFMRAIPFLDRDGLIVGHPTLLYSTIAPLLSQYAATMNAVIDEWISAGFVIKYTDGKTPILFFKGFCKNQALTHYEREGASQFPPPPGYHRTNKGLKPLSNDDGGDIPPSAPKPPKDAPPSVTLDAKTNSGLTPDKVLLKGKEVKENVIEREENSTPAREAVLSEPEPEQHHPLSFSLPSANSGSRYHNREHNQVAEYVTEAKLLGLTASDFRQIVDAILDGLGKKSRANAGNSQVLHESQAAAIELIRYESGKFRTVQAIKSIFDSWTANDYRGDTLPTCEQMLSHAGLMDMGKVTCTRKVPLASSVNVPTKAILLDFKRWLIHTHKTDIIGAIGIPKGALDEQYSKYRQQVSGH